MNTAGVQAETGGKRHTSDSNIFLNFIVKDKAITLYKSTTIQVRLLIPNCSFVFCDISYYIANYNDISYFVKGYIADVHL